MVTMQYIAKKTGLSRYTVSKILNGDLVVKEKSRKKVLAACEKYGFLPNSNAVGLVKGKTSLIGVVMPYITDDFYSEFAEYLDQAALEKGYQLIYRSSYNDSEIESNIIKNFLALKVCAMIIVPVVTNPDLHIHEVAKKNVPLVYFDRPLDGKQYHVLNDNHLGMFKMTEMIIGKGRVPAYLGSFYHESNITAVLREQGYCEAMKAHKLAPRIIDCYNSLSKQDNEQFGYDNTKKLISEGNIPEALLCVTDAVALGAMRAFREAEIIPGQDIMIGGHDNLHFSAFTSPSLSTVRQPKKIFAQTCIKILDDINHDSPPQQKEFIFEPEIIIREST